MTWDEGGVGDGKWEVGDNQAYGWAFAGNV